MNRTTGTLIDILSVLAGITLTPWAISKWSEIGFRIELTFNTGKQEGNSFLLATLIGIALFAYGILNLLFIRQKCFQKDKNEQEEVSKLDR